MKLIHSLQAMLAPVVCFMMAALVLADDKNRKQEPDQGHCLVETPMKHNATTTEDERNVAVISVCVIATVIFVLIIPYFVWQIIRNWGSKKIHTPYPRPQYIRTTFGWVSKEKWELRQAKKAKRKEAKRNRHKIHRTSKANYKWIFYDPTGKLQQQSNELKERSYLRFLPSWMRSYPHGTLHAGILAQQPQAPKGIYELPELLSNENSCCSPLEESLGDYQIDGSPISSALPNLPTLGEPNIIQVWRVRANELPERRGSPRLESEEELRGEVVESPEEVIGRYTEDVSAIGRRRQEAMNQPDPEPIVEEDIFPFAPYQSPRDIQPSPPTYVYQPLLDLDRSVLGPVDFETRRQAYIEGLESRILGLEELQRHGLEGRTERIVRGILVDQRRELHAARGHSYAALLQQDIADLERRIDELRIEPTESPTHGTLNDLMYELRLARLRWDRLTSVAGLPRTIPNALTQLQNNQLNQLVTRIPNAHVAAESRPRVAFHFRTMTSPDGIVIVEVSSRDSDALSDIFRRFALTEVNASVQTTLSIRIRRRANPAMIEGPETSSNTSPSSTLEGRIDEGGNRAEAPSADDTPIPNPTPDDDPQPDFGNPITAALLRSFPDSFNAQTDPTAQPHDPESEEYIRAEALRQTAAFYTEVGSRSSDSDPDAHGRREVDTENDAAPGTGESPASSSEPDAVILTDEDFDSVTFAAYV